MQDGDKLRIEEFMALLHESPQLVHLSLIQGVVRPEELAAAFNQGNKTPQPISLPSLTALILADYPTPDVLNLTLRLIHAPNLERLNLTDLNTAADGFDMDFSSSFEALGNGLLSSFERLVTLELRRISCRSRGAWELFCKKLTEVRRLALGYVSDGPPHPDNVGDVYSSYLSALLRYVDEPDLAPTSDGTTAARKPTTSINAPPEALGRTAEDMDSVSVKVFGSRSGKWATAPPECLSLIFEAGLECSSPEDKLLEVTISDEELCKFISTVTQTCKWWRQVALETPRMWSTLILNDTTPPRKLETWLTRSRAAPLSIIFKVAAMPPTPIATSLLPLLLRHLNRWAQLYFSSDGPRELESLIKAVEGKDAPLLEQLTLGHLGDDDEFTWESSPARLFNGPGSAPRLVDLNFCGVRMDWDHRPFRNLQSLALVGLQSADELKIDQFKSILLESQQLARLSLVGGVLRPGDLTTAFQRTSQTPQPISLPSLDAVLISHYSDPDILTFTFGLIHAPNLRDLRLTNLDSDAEGFDIDFAPIFEFLGTGSFSSFERLEELELRRVSCRSAAAWDGFCTKLTNLRVMSLGYISDGPTGHQDTYGGYLSALIPPIEGESMTKYPSK
ncbi:hypothetical protein FRC01_004267, partial [Tulasnella sp. 417]